PAPIVLFSFQHPAPPVFYTLSLHDALPISPRRRQHSVALPRRREDRLGVRVVNVAHEGPSAGLLLSAITVRCPPASNRTPAAKGDRKSTRLNSSHDQISYAVFCLKKKKHE